MKQLHPFTVRSAMRFMTPPLREALAAFESRMGRAQAAITVYGMPDAGKSTMMAYLLERITAAKSAAVFQTVMASSSINDRQLMRELLTTNGTTQVFHSITPKEALVRSAEAICERLDTPRVLILIDEAQMLTLSHLELLRGLLADLTSVGLAPFAALFAQPEIAQKRGWLKVQGDVSLMNRFLGQLHRFRGLRPAEFREVLALFDETRWPEDGPTYTEYFAPKFWSRGGRLVDLADAFSGQFAEVCRASQQDVIEVPTSYLNESIHAFLAGAAHATLTPAETNRLVFESVRDSPASRTFDFVAGLGIQHTQTTDPRLPSSKERRSRIP